jgi:hypothetical protein
MWGDERSAHTITRFSPGDLEGAVEYFRRWGYVVIENAFPAAQGDAFWRDVERGFAEQRPFTLSVWGQLHTYPDVPLEGRRFPRVIDVESHVPSAPGLMLAPTIVDFLNQYYLAAPTCLQTLTYKYSSEQGAHSDKTLVSPPPAIDYDRETLAAAWLALEDSDESNGALIIYPGSHLLEKRGFFDGFDDDYGKYSAYVDELCRTNGCAPLTYRARAGEILFWHGDFVHAGGAITAKSAELPTRRSLVCHYANLPSNYESRDPQWTRVKYGRASFLGKTEHVPRILAMASSAPAESPAPRAAKATARPALERTAAPIRDPRAAYSRGGRIFSETSPVHEDPNFLAAIAATAGRSIMAGTKLANLYLLLREEVPKLDAAAVVECGAYKGGSALFMAHVLKQSAPWMKVYALDTFEGVPATADVDLHKAGDFADADLPGLYAARDKAGLDNLIPMKGLIQDTLPLVPDSIGLLHIDVEAYSACRAATDIAWSKLARGGYVVYDDADWWTCLGATQAAEELMMEHRIHSEQVCPHWVFKKP